MWRGQNRWHSPQQLKPLGRIRSNCLRKPLRRILSGFRGIGGIFEFHPRSRDNELFVAHFRVFLEPPKGFHKKIEPIRPRGLSCRGGAIDFGPSTSYNSGTSVLIFATGLNTYMKGRTRYGRKGVYPWIVRPDGFGTVECRSCLPSWQNPRQTKSGF